jgi:hypothetical protein
MVLQEFGVSFTVDEINVWEFLICRKTVKSEVVKHSIIFKLDGRKQ